jgi:hypothetical protein
MMLELLPLRSGERLPASANTISPDCTELLREPPSAGAGCRLAR